MTAADRNPPGTRRLLRLTALVSTLDRFAMSPMLLAIAADLAVPLGQVVTAAGVYFLAYGVMQPVWGLLSDRIGLVRTLRLTLAAGAVATMLSTLAWSVVALAVARGLAGSFFAAAVPGTLVYVGDTVPPQQRRVGNGKRPVRQRLRVAQPLPHLLADVRRQRGRHQHQGLGHRPGHRRTGLRQM